MIERTEELLLQELRDLYDAEKQLVKALPKMSRAASDSELEQALRQHLEETREQVQRLEQAFDILGTRARSRPCLGMKGIVEEGNEVMGEEAPGPLADSALIGAGQRVEHYEIGSYENCIGLAESAGQREIAGLLNETLNEERQASRKLMEIGKRLLHEAELGSVAEEGREFEETTRRRTASRGRRASSRGRGRTASARGGRAISPKRAGRPAKARGRRSTSATSRGTSRGAGTRSASTRARRGTASSRSTSRSSTARGRSSGRGAKAQITTDHDIIRRWAEERSAHPACVKGTGGRGDIGMLRLDFPGYTGAESLQPISWQDWFRKFDERDLALLYQERTARGQKSNFNKLVSREIAQGAGRARPRARGAA